MKTVNFNLVKLEADEGKCFDWAEPHFNEGEEEHLYSKVIFLGINDSADNYIEIDEPEEEQN